jgi:FkbM family methyltransferase
VLIRHEGIKLKVDPADSYHRIFIKAAVKRRIGRFIGHHYRTDDYLLLAYRTLQTVKNPVVVDVGCNIGTTVLPLASRFPEGTFVAIDAHPIPLARMIENVRLNKLKNVGVVAAGISDEGKMTRIYTCPFNSGAHRLSGFEGRADVAAAGPNYDNITVAVLSLREVMLAHNVDRCDLLKIDVEGFELRVLKSLRDWLCPQRIPSIVCEWGAECSRAVGSTGWGMVAFMRRLGYQCRDLHSGSPIQTEADIPDLDDFTTTDFLFTGGALRSEFRAC